MQLTKRVSSKNKIQKTLTVSRHENTINVSNTTETYAVRREVKKHIPTNAFETSGLLVSEYYTLHTRVIQKVKAKYI